MNGVKTSARVIAGRSRRAAVNWRVPVRASLLAGLIALPPWAPGATADAQESVAATAGPARYEVEIIVFRNLDQRGNTPETPAPRAGQPPVDGAGAGAIPQAGGAWPALEPAALELAPLAARLRKSGAYQVLYHGGWVQPVERQDRTVPSPLPDDAAGSGARGSITLYRERYLHALVDIGLQAADGTTDELQRVRQGRRLRGQAIQYFDSPALGVIVAARPLDGGAAAEPESVPGGD